MEISVPSYSGAPQTGEDPRQILDRLIAERGEDYAGLSRLIGRNPAYIQQYIKRGSPRRLDERDRALLADYFRIDERLLGGPAAPASPVPDDMLLPVPRLDVGASAGAGSLSEDDRAEALFAFDKRWLRRMSHNPDRLAIIRVEGDSMVPTLRHGDDIMVDSSDAAARLRDGIYVLRRDGVLLVKRLARALSGGRVTIISDNSAYPTEVDVAVGELDLVGRVLWTGRCV
jgi:phage repressor protein C with HTH and peptisase S24 domain